MRSRISMIGSLQTNIKLNNMVRGHPKEVLDIILELSRRPRIKKKISNGKQRKSTISEQDVKIFGHCKKYENYESKMPYPLEKSRCRKHFSQKEKLLFIVMCVASLWDGVSIRLSVRRAVGPSGFRAISLLGCQSLTPSLRWLLGASYTHFLGSGPTGKNFL